MDRRQSHGYRKSHLKSQIFGIGFSGSMFLLALITFALNLQNKVTDLLVIPENSVSTIARLMSYLLLVLSICVILGGVVAVVYDRSFLKKVEPGFVAVITNFFGDTKVTFENPFWLIPHLESYTSFDNRERSTSNVIPTYTRDLANLKIHTNISWRPKPDCIDDIIQLKIGQEKELRKVIEQTVTRYVGRLNLIELQDELGEFERRLIDDLRANDISAKSLQANGIVLTRIQITKLELSKEMDEVLQARLLKEIKDQVETRQYGRPTQSSKRTP